MVVYVSCCRKARRKEREGEPAGDPKLYLQEALLERKLPDVDMRQLVDLPHGLDYNEWLASHSQYLLHLYYSKRTYVHVIPTHNDVAATADVPAR
jgi:hypothetical protein